MSDTSKPGTYASPPCMAGEVDPAYFDPLVTDPAQARDVARWRKAERQRLRRLRGALSVTARQEVGRSLADHLRTVVQERFNGARCRRAMLPDSTTKRAPESFAAVSKSMPGCTPVMS